MNNECRKPPFNIDFIVHEVFVSHCNVFDTRTVVRILNLHYEKHNISFDEKTVQDVIDRLVSRNILRAVTSSAECGIEGGYVSRGIESVAVFRPNDAAILFDIMTNHYLSKEPDEIHVTEISHIMAGRKLLEDGTLSVFPHGLDTGEWDTYICIKWKNPKDEALFLADVKKFVDLKEV